MRKVLKVEPKTELIGIASEVVYMQKPYWCNANVRQLKLSIMKPRHWYPYDNMDRKNPVIFFVCGGGFAKQDINVWNAELAYFAKHGYAVITAEYSVLPFTKWPDGCFVVAYDTDKISNSTRRESILFVSRRKARAVFQF